MIFDKTLLDTFAVLELRAGDLDAGGRFTRNVADDTASRYWLRGRIIPGGHDARLGLRSLRRIGDLAVCYNTDAHGVRYEIADDGNSGFCLMTVLAGAAELVDGPGGTAEGHPGQAIMYRGLPGARFNLSDGFERVALWIESDRLRRTLHTLLDEPPRDRLAFAPAVDWTRDRHGAIRRMIGSLIAEMRDPDGITSDPFTSERFQDLLARTLLGRLEHNYSARLRGPAPAAIPWHLRRAEAFMHASAGQPLALTDIAAAAGCGTRTLHAAFRQFRDTTPLAALNAIRLGHAREALRAADGAETAQAVARRLGFTNPSRFAAAYVLRFGEHPTKTRAHSRS